MGKNNPIQLFATINDYTAYFVLSMIGGFVDCLGFQAFFMVFVSSITGNIVLSASQINGKFEGAECRTFVTLAFCLGALLTNLVSVLLKYKMHISLRKLGALLLISESIIMAIFMGAVHKHKDLIINIDSLATIAHASLLAFSMGVQAGTVNECFHGFPSTTVITATLANFSGALSSTIIFYIGTYHPSILYAKAEEPEVNDPEVGLIRKQSVSLPRADSMKDYTDEEYAHMRSIHAVLKGSVLILLKGFVTLLGFISGCLIGAVGWKYFNYFSMLYPIILLLLLSIDLLIPYPKSDDVKK